MTDPIFRESDTRCRPEPNPALLLSSRSRASRHPPPIPYRQGDLDGFCGLYVLINAITVLAAHNPPVAVDPKQLLGAGLAAVAARMPLAQAVLDGIEPELWIEALRAMLAMQGDQLSPPFQAKLLFDPAHKAGARSMRRAINSALDAGAVVAVSLGGLHDHYTMIVRHTATRYVLHDSGDLRWLAKAACGTDRSSRRHRVGLRWVLALERTAGSHTTNDTPTDCLGRATAW